MNSKVTESALSNIAHRLHSLQTHISQLTGLLKTPATLAGILGPTNDGQAAVVQSLTQIRNDLKEAADPLLQAWLHTQGAVIGERVCFSILNRAAHVPLTDAERAELKAMGETYREPPTLDEIQVSGTITELRLDRWKHHISVILSQPEVVHRNGAQFEPQSFADGVAIVYRKKLSYHDSISMTTAPNELSIGIPIRQARQVDLAMTKG